MLQPVDPATESSVYRAVSPSQWQGDPAFSALPNPSDFAALAGRVLPGVGNLIGNAFQFLTNPRVGGTALALVSGPLAAGAALAAPLGAVARDWGSYLSAVPYVGPGLGTAVPIIGGVVSVAAPVVANVAGMLTQLGGTAAGLQPSQIPQLGALPAPPGTSWGCVFESCKPGQAQTPVLDLSAFGAPQGVPLVSLVGDATPQRTAMPGVVTP